MRTDGHQTPWSGTIHSSTLLVQGTAQSTLKTVRGASPSRVRIPVSPPSSDVRVNSPRSSSEAGAELPLKDLPNTVSVIAVGDRRLDGLTALIERHPSERVLHFGDRDP